MSSRLASPNGSVSPRKPRPTSADMTDVISERAEERAGIQAKTFTRWINVYLEKRNDPVKNLFADLRNGKRLLKLVEELTDGAAKLRAEKGSEYLHRLANVNKALDYLTKTRGLNLVSIHPASLVDGDRKSTLGFVWEIIQHFHIANSDAEGDAVGTARSRLLVWCQTSVEGYADVTIENFSSSWRDGRAFCALLHRYRPDLVEFDHLRTASSPGNDAAARGDLKVLFDVAEKELGVARLLDPEDVNRDKPDEQSIMTYVATLRRAIDDHSHGT